MTTEKPPFRWTVMIYLAGDNNLTNECIHQLTEMKEVDDLDGICVLAQLDPKGGRLKSHRYEIKPNRISPSLGSDFAKRVENKKKFKHPRYRDYAARWRRRSGPGGQEDDETNTGSPVTLFDFVTWGIEQYPADCYMLVLSGHGGGTEKGYLLRDENPADALTIWEMQVALEEIRNRHGVEIDILGMDSCLMTMAEVSYQLRGLAKLLVGSEGYSPLAGWPFKQVLARMREELKGIPKENGSEKESKSEERKERERKAIAKGVVEEYVDYYLDYAIGGLSVEQSCLDLTQIDGLKPKIDKLATAMRAELSNNSFKKAIVYAHWEAQSFNGEQFVDLYDFCQLLKRYYPGKDGIAGACQDVLETEKAFVPNSCYSGPTYQYARGVSIYFPWAEIDPNYYAVRFSRNGRRESAWMKFLKEYVVETRRPQRHREPGELFGYNSDPYTMRHAPDRHAPDRMLVNQVWSMRNPPLSAGLSPCIREKRELKNKALNFMSKRLKHSVGFKEDDIKKNGSY